MAKHQVVLEFGAPKIEVPVTQPEFLGRHLVATSASHRQRRRDCRPDNRERGHPHFHLTRAHVWVHAVGLARHDLTFAQHDRLHPDRRRQCLHVGGTPRRPERELHQPGAVTQIDEDQSPEIAAAVHPPAEADDAPHVTASQQAAGISAQGGGQHGLVWGRRHQGQNSRKKRGTAAHPSVERRHGGTDSANVEK